VIDLYITKIHVSCACTQLSVSVWVPTPALPLKLYLCHCNTCRHVSGHLAITFVAVPKSKWLLRVKGKPGVLESVVGQWASSTPLKKAKCTTVVYPIGEFISSQLPAFPIRKVLCP
jgi:hypothetical protein